MRRGGDLITRDFAIGRGGFLMGAFCGGCLSGISEVFVGVAFFGEHASEGLGSVGLRAIGHGLFLERD